MLTMVQSFIDVRNAYAIGPRPIAAAADIQERTHTFA